MTNYIKTILINILGYEMFPQYDDYINKTAIVLRDHRECEVLDDVEWWFIELPKFRKAHPDMNIKINQWLAFIDDEDKELIEMAEKKNKILKEARNEVNYLTGNEAIRRMAELREKWDLEYEMSMEYAKKLGKEQGMKEGKEQGMKEGEEQGMKEGKEQGIKEGIKKERIEIAKKMKEQNMNVEDIIKITGLTKDEIESIK